MKTTLILAINRLGGVSSTARAIGLTQPAVSNWLRRGRTTVDGAIKLEKATGGAITRRQLRPDVFGD